MVLQDDRTDWESQLLTTLVGGRDTFLSSFGPGLAGGSYAYWACHPSDAKTVAEWVRSRSEFVNVRIVPHDGNARARARKAHVHVYAVRSGHPALGGGPSNCQAVNLHGGK